MSDYSVDRVVILLLYIILSGSPCLVTQLIGGDSLTVYYPEWFPLSDDSVDRVVILLLYIILSGSPCLVTQLMGW